MSVPIQPACAEQGLLYDLNKQTNNSNKESNALQTYVSGMYIYIQRLGSTTQMSWNLDILQCNANHANQDTCLHVTVTHTHTVRTSKMDFIVFV